MTDRSSPEQTQLAIFLQANRAHVEAIHDVAAAAYNQIRFLGLPRDNACKAMVRSALSHTLATAGEPTGSSSAVLALIMKKAAAPYPAPSESVESDRTLNYFRYFFEMGGTEKMARLAREVTTFALNDPACGTFDEPLHEGARRSGYFVAVIDATDNSLRQTEIQDAMNHYVATAVSDQLEHLFINHDRLMTAIANTKRRDLGL